MGISEASVTVIVSLVTPEKRAVWSTPVSMFLFSRWRGMSEVKATIGTEAL